MAALSKEEQMDKTRLEHEIQMAAQCLRVRFDIRTDEPPENGFVLGTGWGDLLQVEDERIWPMSQLRGFTSFEEIAVHRRVVSYGKVGGKRAIALRGRFHLNEKPYDAALAAAVRSQVQMLCELGVRTFVLTNAAGALGDKARVGDVVAADGFVSLFAPDMPLFAGEFCSPDDVLDDRLRRLAREQALEGLTVREGGYVMLRGPYFEGRKYDKALLRASGASCVGMSTLPEACVIALYRAQGAQALALSYITNDDREEHSHEENLARAEADAPKLSELLTRIATHV